MRIADYGDWVIVPLKDVVAKLVDGSHSPPAKQDVGRPMLSARNIENNKIVFDEYRLISENDFMREHARSRVSPGDVLLTIVGTIGRSAVVPAGMKEITLQRSVAVITPRGLIPKYLMYQLQAPFIQRHFAAYARGTAQKGVYLKTLGETPIRLAPIEQQERIVAEIEKQFSRLDEAIANLKRVKANLKRYKAAVLKAAVEGKLTEQWRKDHPDVEPAEKLLERILAERRRKWEEAELAKQKASGKNPKDDKWKSKYEAPALPTLEKVPEAPHYWTFAGIEQLVPAYRDAVKTGPFGSLLKKHEHRQEGIAVLGIENIQAMRFVPGSKIFITAEKAEQLEGYRTVPGDVLISRSGTVGEVCVVPDDVGEARISTNLMKISLVEAGMHPAFFTFLFNGSPFVLRQVAEFCKGSTRAFLNQDILKRLVFSLPPYKEQRVIIQEVEQRISLVERLMAEVDHNLRRAQRLRQSILRKAFSGTLLRSPRTA